MKSVFISFFLLERHNGEEEGKYLRHRLDSDTNPPMNRSQTKALGPPIQVTQNIKKVSIIWLSRLS